MADKYHTTPIATVNRALTGAFPPLIPSLSITPRDIAPSDLRHRTTYDPATQTDDVSVLNCMFFNSRSVKNKLSELHYILYSSNFDIICVVESWLTNYITDAMLDPQCVYDIFRHDRPSHAGGVVAFVLKCLHADVITLPDKYRNLECVVFDLCGRLCKLRLFVIYRAGTGGNSPANTRHMQRITECLMHYCSGSVASVVIGDLNCELIDWSRSSVPFNSLQSLFLNCILNLGFTQYIRTPTRGNNILDILLSNSPQLISDAKVCENISPSCDHLSITFKINLVIDRLSKAVENNMSHTTTVPDWLRADWNSFFMFLEDFDWCVPFSNCATADDAYNIFTTVINSLVEANVPKKNLKYSASELVRKHPKYIIKLMNKKAAVWKKIQSAKSNNNRSVPALTLIYKKLSSECRIKLNLHRKSIDNKILSSNNPNCFYKYVNSKTVRKSTIGSLKDQRGTVVTDDRVKADLFNSHFASIFTNDNGILPLCTKFVPITNTLENITFSSNQILKLLVTQSSKMSAGPDGLPPILFRKLAHCLSSPLCILFQKLFDLGELPSVWKLATVIPIFKKGSTANIENYRPISLTCVASKLYESILKSNIGSYLEKNQILNVAQHGFLPRNSATTNLLGSLHDWTKSYDNKKCTEVIYVDFAKAFDTVSHAKLLYKLSTFGITGSIFLSIRSFLSDRKQRVRIGNYLSDLELVISGVPQGTVLGPMLFLLFIDDLIEALSPYAKVKAFADDLKMYITLNTVTDYTELQRSLDILYEWSSKWQMNLAINKCYHTKFGPRYEPIQNGPKSNLLINGLKLDYVSQVKDLGILFDCNLSFTPHINTIVAKAKQKVFLLFRCFKSNDINYLLRGYKSYVLPILDYCSSIWSPSKISDILAIESVQRTFTKRLSGLCTLPYSDRLKKLNLVSLELRRLRTDLLLCYNTMHGHNSINPIDIGLILNENITRGNGLKLVTPLSRLNVRAHFFSCRVIPVWNSLSDQQVDACSSASFKASLFKTDLSRFLICF